MAYVFCYQFIVIAQLFPMQGRIEGTNVFDLKVFEYTWPTVLNKGVKLTDSIRSSVMHIRMTNENQYKRIDLKLPLCNNRNQAVGLYRDVDWNVIIYW